MRKLFLSLVLILATGSTLMNATSNIIEKFNLSDDCTADAWEWGTEAGDGDRQQEYEQTDSYFKYYCNEDGTYKPDMVISED